MADTYGFNVFTGKLDLVDIGVIVAYYLLLQNADILLQEDGFKLRLEG